MAFFPKLNILAELTCFFEKFGCIRELVSASCDPGGGEREVPFGEDRGAVTRQDLVFFLPCV